MLLAKPTAATETPRVNRLGLLIDKAVIAKMDSGRTVTKRDSQHTGPARSAEFRRILALPARTPALDDPELTTVMNRWLARVWPLPACTCGAPAGSDKHDRDCKGVSLRHAQARAISEAIERRGGVSALGVGVGKTLTAILLATAFRLEHGIERPLILCPSGLVRSFQRAIERARDWWQVIPGLEDRVVGYSKLSLVGNEDLLERMAPGVVIADESQNLAGRNSARGKRFQRLFKTFPGTRFVGLSGTIVKKSPLDYWHLMRLALGDDAAPLPRSWPEMAQWAAAITIDPETGEPSLPPGCLPELGDPGDTAGEAFAKRVLRTPGVVSTRGASVDASIYCRILTPALPGPLQEAVKSVESAWEIPDGHVIADASGMHRAVSQLSLGFYSKLVFPKGVDKDAWYEARRNWARFVREAGRKWTLKLDSELAVANAVDGRTLPDPDGVLARWRQQKRTITPENVTVWLDREYTPHCVRRWLQDGGGLVWSHWVPVGELLAEALDLPWYGAGSDPEADAPFPAAIMSVMANKEGRNLQFANRNLCLTMTPAADVWQQLIGRTHRQGQSADTVYVDFFTPTERARAKLQEARNLAPWLAKQTGEPQKLQIADWVE